MTMDPGSEWTLNRADLSPLIDEADSLFERLFPLCRSLTGNGVRQTLEILQQVAPFDILEIPSGTPCYDWAVPDEWNIRGAYVDVVGGPRVIDFGANNLHVVGYSVPVDAVMSFEELEPHLFSLPDLPSAIPYRTSYYNRTWGFCLSQVAFSQLDRSATYHVVIDSEFKQGSMTMGERRLDGTSGEEYLISSYCCHPSMANDSLSGIILWSLLLRELSSHRTRHAYRFVILPETIGSIAYLSQHEKEMQRLAGGFIPTTVAGPGSFGYKHTFLGDHLIDRVVHQTFAELGVDYIPYPFDINGSDETQYSAPNFRIPIGTIAKDKYYEYDYYHTSLDDLDFVSSAGLVDTLKLYLSSIEKLELNFTYHSLHPYSEPMYGKRDLYPKLGGSIRQRAVDLEGDHAHRPYQVSEREVVYGSELDAMRWVMFYGDGRMSILDIAERTNLPVRQLHETAEKLCVHGLMERLPDKGDHS